MDGFKEVNDSLGHDVGDELLKLVAERLLNCLRKSDTVARFGGDEFVALLGKDNHTLDISVVAEKVIQSIAQPFFIGEHEIKTSTSLGIAQGTFDNTSSTTLLKDADTALYRAKSEGKNNFKIFDFNMEKASKARVKFMQQLRKGIKKDSYLLHFQPILDSTNSTLRGFEALIRFKDDNSDTLFPDDFIQYLEESNLILDVGKWVFESVCSQLKQWQAMELFPTDGYISFNVSAKQLLDPRFLDYIYSSCKYYDVAPKHLVLEITETTIITNPSVVETVLNNLRSFGLRIALDDFGTGFSSMSYLQKYPFDFLKIDKSFVQSVSESSTDVKIITAIIGLAKSFGLTVCAEGVETKASQEKVIALGADLLQGFLISKPIPSHFATRYLTNASNSSQ